MSLTESPPTFSCLKNRGRSVWLFLLLLFVASLPLCATAQGNPHSTTPPPPNPADQQSAWNMELVGFNDLQGRSTYQPIIIHQGGREIAYMAHHAGTAFNPLTGRTESNGTSICDVTDPRNPKYLFHIPGPPGPISAAGAPVARSSRCAGCPSAHQSETPL